MRIPLSGRRMVPKEATLYITMLHCTLFFPSTSMSHTFARGMVGLLLISGVAPIGAAAPLALDASCTRITAPSSIKAGGSFRVVTSIKNTGTEKWTPEQKLVVEIGAPWEGRTIKLRRTVEVSRSINLAISLTAPEVNYLGLSSEASHS